MSHQIQTTGHSEGLADILERILDKGLVIAGDVTISIADIELLKIKIRLLVCSVDKAREIGIDWWQSDPSLSSKARELLNTENETLKARIAELEKLAVIAAAPTGTDT